MPPRAEPRKEDAQRPLPPQGAEEGHAVLLQPQGGEERHLDRVRPDDEEKGPVLNLGGRLSRLGGLEQGVVDDGARGDEGAARDHQHQQRAYGVARDVARVLEGERGDPDRLGVLGCHVDVVSWSFRVLVVCCVVLVRQDRRVDV